MAKGGYRLPALDTIEGRIAKLHAQLKEAKAVDARLDKLRRFIKNNKYEAADVGRIYSQMNKANRAVKGPVRVKSRNALHKPPAGFQAFTPQEARDLAAFRRLDNIRSRAKKATGKDQPPIAKTPGMIVALRKHWANQKIQKALRKAAK